MIESTNQGSTKPAVKLIDFYADWCGPCRAMDPFMPEVEAAFAGKVEFEKVDVDKEQDRANAAGVMSIPTLHIVKNDKIIETLIGYQSKEELTKRLNAAIG